MTSRVSRSSFAPTVNFESVLEKQGKLPGSFMVKKYWCVLDDSKLTYYKDAKKGPSSGCINISHVQSVMRSSKGHSFHLITNSATHTFVASCAELREQWVKALQDAMAITSRKLSLGRQSVLSGGSVDQDSDTEPDESGCNTVPPSSSSSHLQITRKQGEEDVFMEVGSSMTLDAAHIQPSLTDSKPTYQKSQVSTPQPITQQNSEHLRMEQAFAAVVENSAYSAAESSAVKSSDIAGGHVAGEEMLEKEKNDKSVEIGCIEQDLKVQEEVAMSSSPIPDGSLTGTASSDTDASSIQTVPSTVTEKNVPETPGVNLACGTATVPVAEDKQSRVTKRRDSRLPKQDSTVKATPVIELKVAADFESPSLVPDLANARLSLDTQSAIDDLRSYLENDSGSSAVSSFFPSILAHDSKPGQAIESLSKPGQAIESLRFFLARLD